MYIQRMPRESTLEVVLKRADFGKRAVWVVRAQVDKRQTTSTSLKMVISFLLLLFSLPFFSKFWLLRFEIFKTWSIYTEHKLKQRYKKFYNLRGAHLWLMIDWSCNHVDTKILRFCVFIDSQKEIRCTRKDVPCWTRSDQGQTIETSALNSLCCGKSTLSTQLIKPNYIVTTPTDAATQFLQKLTLFRYKLLTEVTLFRFL